MALCLVEEMAMFGFGKGHAERRAKQERENYRSLVLSSVSYLSGFSLTVEWIGKNYPGAISAADEAYSRSQSIERTAVFVLISVLNDQCKQLRDRNPAKADAIVASIQAGNEDSLFQSPLEDAIRSAHATAEIWGRGDWKIPATDAEFILSEAVGTLAGQDESERVRRRISKILDA